MQEQKHVNNKIMKENTYIINFGGSLVVPDLIDTKLLREFRELIIDRVTNHQQKFVIIVGGGKTARQYQGAASEIIPGIPDEDKDWIGIHATRLNAQLLRTIFREHVFPKINTNPHDLEDFYHSRDAIMIAAGWKPGFSTDYDTVLLGRYLGIKTILNLSNIDYIYDKDPRKNPDAKKIEEISWGEFREMFGSQWKPGMSTPFDPIAAEFADKEDLEVVTMNGANMENLRAYLNDESFTGSVIKNG
jgi:uridylate kinase